MTTSHHGAAAQLTLPDFADLQQLKRQARELLRAWRAGDHPSLERAAPYRQGDAAAPPTLSLAQLVIARELGFPSWPALHRAVMAQQEARQLDNAALVTRSLALALGQPAALARLGAAAALAWPMPTGPARGPGLGAW